MSKKYQVNLITFFLLFIFTLNAAEYKITCLFNNESDNEGVTIKEWGFATFVQHIDKLILFDGGSSGAILDHNAKALGIDLTMVDMAVLSHSHTDHITGFDHLLEINPDVKLFLPDDFSIGGMSEIENEEWNEKYQIGYRFKDADITFVNESMEIAPGVVLIPTSSMLCGWFSKYPPHNNEPKVWGIAELSLVLQNKDEQWILLSGCSHSQVDKIVRETNAFLDSDVIGVAGGFHLLPYSTEFNSEIAMTMKNEFKINWVAPTHCTGTTAQKIFLDLFQDQYKNFGLGSTIDY